VGAFLLLLLTAIICVSIVVCISLIVFAIKELLKRKKANKNEQ
jgi:hypothetical protein